MELFVLYSPSRKQVYCTQHGWSDPCEVRHLMSGLMFSRKEAQTQAERMRSLGLGQLNDVEPRALQLSVEGSDIDCNTCTLQTT